MTRPTDPRAQVLANYRAQLDAMISRDTDALGACLTEDFTLTHMSGYVQTRAQWLTEMAAGEFRYHSVEPQGEPRIDIAGDSAMSWQGYRPPAASRWPPGQRPTRECTHSYRDGFATLEPSTRTSGHAADRADASPVPAWLSGGWRVASQGAVEVLISQAIWGSGHR